MYAHNWSNAEFKFFDLFLNYSNNYMSKLLPTGTGIYFQVCDEITIFYISVTMKHSLT